jgi:signal transduction histidine kinase
VLAAGVAHEINNPIGYVSANLRTLGEYVADLLKLVAAYEQAEDAIASAAPHQLSAIARSKREIGLDDLRGDVAELGRETAEGLARVTKIVQDLKDFSHTGECRWQYADLHKGIDSTLNIAWNELKHKVEVVKQYGALPEIECLPSELNQVFMSLFVNAAQAIKARGVIRIETGADIDGVWVEVADSGSGIAPEHLQRIFEPFFSTKPVGQGTGLGLSLSYATVKKHHGRLDVRSTVGEGTTFRVWLPLTQQVEAALA